MSRLESGQEWRVLAALRQCLPFEGRDWASIGELSIWGRAPLEERFWELARYHGVDLLLVERFSRQPGLAERIPESLRREAKQNLFNNFELAAKLVTIASEAEAAGIRLFCFKGPMIAVTGYGNLRVRAAGDLDLLIRREDLERVVRLLSDLGFRAKDELDGRSYRQTHFHLPFEDDQGYEVEVHWAVSRPHCHVAFEVDRLWMRRETVSLQGRSLPGISAEDHVLILCVHGLRHLWERWIWVGDLAGVLDRYPHLDWDFLVSEARRLGCSRMLHLGLMLVVEVFDAPVPLRVQRLGYGEPTVRNTFLKILRDYQFGAVEQGVAQRDWGFFRLRERWMDKVRFLFFFPAGDYRDSWRADVAAWAERQRLGEPVSAGVWITLILKRLGISVLRWCER